MGQVNQPEDLTSRIRALEQQVRDLQRGRTLNGTVMSQGSMDVQTPDGHTIWRVGAFEVDGNLVYGVAGFRYNGSIAFWSFDTPSGGGYTSLWDEAGNICVSTDTISGNGLATPYLPIPFVSNSTVVPTDTTTSGTFATLQFAKHKLQHPKLWAFVLCRASDGSTSGEVQVLVGGNALGAAQAIGLGEYGYKTFGPTAIPVAYTHLGAVDIEIQARRTAGAGTIGVRVVGAYGQQT